MHKYITKLESIANRFSLLNLIPQCLLKRYQNTVITQVLAKQESLWAFPWAPDNEEIVREIVSKDGSHLIDASIRLQNNKELMLLAMTSEPGKNLDGGFYWLKDKIIDVFKDDFDIVSIAIKQNKISYDELSDRLKNNVAIALLAIEHENRYYICEHIMDNFSDNKEVVLEIVKYDSLLDKASDRLKDDKDVVLQAINHYSEQLRYVSDRLKDDYDIIMAAVKKDGNLIKYASERLKDDDTIVMTAVQKDGYVIKYASERLKNDDAIVMRVLQNDVSAFREIGKKFQNDYELSLKVIRADLDNFKYVSENLKQNHEFLLDLTFTLGDISRYINELWENNSPSIYFLMKNHHDIEQSDWPIIKKALLYKPYLVINPPSSIQELFRTFDNKLVMYSQYALNHEWISNLQSEELPEDIFKEL